MNEKRTNNSKKVNKGMKKGYNPLSQNEPEKNQKIKKRMKLRYLLIKIPIQMKRKQKK